MLKKKNKNIFNATMRWVYISPHFDDAVLSCGGLIWEQTHSGIPVEVWTVMAGDPPTGPVSDLIARVHFEWNTGTPQETVALRRIEDRNAARHVGANVRHLKVVDALYRRTNTGNLLYTQDVLGAIPVHPRDAGLVEEVTHQIAENLSQHDTIVCPLGLGNHVDHIITRQAVEALHRPTWYYADVPYVLRNADSLAPATMALKGKTFFISSQGLAAWQKGIAAYASQMSTLFDGVQDMRAKIKNYQLSRNGLTIWDHQ
jgi:LmbE family N-acetylglucosaminyl deacetylase